MLAYNIRSDEVTVLADGKEKPSQFPSVCVIIIIMTNALSLLQFQSVD